MKQQQLGVINALFTSATEKVELLLVEKLLEAINIIASAIIISQILGAERNVSTACFAIVIWLAFYVGARVYLKEKYVPHH